MRIIIIIVSTRKPRAIMVDRVRVTPMVRVLRGEAKVFYNIIHETSCRDIESKSGLNGLMTDGDDFTKRKWFRCI